MSEKEMHIISDTFCILVIEIWSLFDDWCLIFGILDLSLLHLPGKQERDGQSHQHGGHRE
jgi:hypothetical protein